MNELMRKTYFVENVELTFATGKPSIITTTKLGASVTEGTKDYSDVYGSHYYINLAGADGDYVINKMFNINSASCKRAELELEGVTLTGSLQFIFGFNYNGTDQVEMSMYSPITYNTQGVILQNQKDSSANRTQQKIFASTEAVSYADIDMGVAVDYENNKSIAHFDYSYVENTASFATGHDMNIGFRAFLVGAGNTGSVKIRRIKITIYS